MLLFPDNDYVILLTQLPRQRKQNCFHKKSLVASLGIFFVQRNIIFSLTSI